jgi:hypothetical protein
MTVGRPRAHSGAARADLHTVAVVARGVVEDLKLAGLQPPDVGLDAQ